MNKLALSLVFILAGSSFVAYSFLDTFIIPKNTRAVSFNDDDFWGEMSSSSVLPISTSSSEGKPDSSINPSSSEPITTSNEPISSTPIDSSNISINEYYENLTSEQIAALFTNEAVFREYEHYSDPDIYIDITTHRDEADTTYYYVADVRIKNLRYFKTALANDTFGENVSQRTSDQCKSHHGILAISGDNYGAQEAGYVLRNGQILRTTKSSSNLGSNPRKLAEDLAIYRDGTFEIFDEKTTDLQTIADKGAWQVFSFGPGLVKNGELAVTEDSEVDSILKNGASTKCQRMSVGIIAPLHYCFVVCDGRSTESAGFSLFEMAKIMKDLHCYQAYNLDGGGSATMYLDDGTGNANRLGHLINKPNQNYYNAGSPNPQQRGVSDIVYIGKE